jgi:D-serine deaminase-like pyridoxal phosphate-dependent protein
MRSDLTDRIERPTLLLDEDKARANLKRMAAKAAAAHVRFRPHFKTHQSAQIGEWFQDEGVTAITVSSLSMAAYFAGHGWKDILVAFPVNLREMNTIRRLSAQVRLGLLVESQESVAALGEQLSSEVDVWIKIDTGLHRAGIDVMDVDAVKVLASDIQRYPRLHLRGLLTHAGQTYHVHTTHEITDTYAQSWQSLVALRDKLAQAGIPHLETSVGDTPGCTLSGNLGTVDEVRPGNFIFYDSIMFDLGVCAVEDIAVAVACPVVALHPQRHEAVIYGGAIHFSKEALISNGLATYGYAAFPSEHGWQFTSRENCVISSTQEHGVLRLRPSDFDRLQVGGLVDILPVHSCLTVAALKNYLTLNGEVISTLNSCSD